MNDDGDRFQVAAFFEQPEGPFVLLPLPHEHDVGDLLTAGLAAGCEEVAENVGGRECEAVAVEDVEGFGVNGFGNEQQG